MFVEAIETAIAFTRPIHLISRNYGSNTVHPGAATLFFVNSDGWALTCRHVANQLQIANQLTGQYKAFNEELTDRRGKKKEKQLRRDLERKYKFSSRTTVEIRCRFMNCVKGKLDIKARFHSKLDIALLKFDFFEQLLCESFPTFPKDTSALKQGKFLCRLGFPFPEFTNFTYDANKDSIDWTTTGKSNTPRFPIEGMVTRHLVDESGEKVGFEMSTPGLRGQSGGPAFDTNGNVWGMQAATRHLDLNFDVDQEVIRGGLPRRV